MPDYKNGKIYTIRTQHTDKIYIGSTTQPLHKRLFEHVRKYRNYLKDSKVYRSSMEIIKHGDFYIELYEKYPCSDKSELCKREGEVIRECKNICVNKYIAGRTNKEWNKDHEEKRKIQKSERYQKNKERLQQKYTCACGVVLSLWCKSRHEKTKTHLNFINNRILRDNKI